MIVVTAAGGRTGTALVRALRERGERVRAVVSLQGRPPRTHAEHLAGLPGAAHRVGERPG